MPFRILPTWSARLRSTEPMKSPARKLRVGIPRVLNQWSTHRFWPAFFTTLGIAPRDIVWSSNTSEAQQREFGQGRGVVDCCYPVKALTGHYGELIDGQKRKIDILFSPKIKAVPSVLSGKVDGNLSCPRVMAGPESARAGFQRERDAFTQRSISYVSPVVNMDEPLLAARQLHAALKDVLPGLTQEEVNAATKAGFAALAAFETRMRQASLEIIRRAVASNSPVILALGRPYHMDTGIGHDIESELQAQGYPILWGQYLPNNPELLNWLFADDLRTGRIASPYDISDVWQSSYSANTNELLWGAKYAARLPWVACVIRFSSYECGMDQPTLTPVQAITEESGTLFFTFGDLDATKPAGSVRIRVETIIYYLGRRSAEIIRQKRKAIAAPPELLLSRQQAQVTAGL
jgi:predicted nucleotide-binding protein (sugar kinase/HSP70/actin superfamily)